MSFGDRPFRGMAGHRCLDRRLTGWVDHRAARVCPGVDLHAGYTYREFSPVVEKAAEKRPSAAFLSSFVIAAYIQVRLTPQDFGRLASGHF